jgi:hypothetical protein
MNGTIKPQASTASPPPKAGPSDPATTSVEGVPTQGRIGRVFRRLGWIRGLQVAVFLIGLPIAWILTRWNVDPSFAVVAATERIEFHVLPGHQPRWWLSDVSLLSDGIPIPGLAERFSGSIVPASGARVSIRRVSQGPLFLTFDAGDRSAGELFNARGERVARLGTNITVRWNDLAARVLQGSTITLPLDRGVQVDRVGEVASYRSNSLALLRSGRVAVLKRSLGLFGGDVQEIASTTLDAGDKLEFPSTPTADGFITADERPALTVSLRVVAPHAWITPTGGVRREVDATVFDSLRNDGGIQTVVLIFAFLYGIFQMIGSIQSALAPKTDAVVRTPGPPSASTGQTQVVVGGDHPESAGGGSAQPNACPPG